MSVVNVINIVSIVTFEKKKTLLVIKTQFGVKKDTKLQINKKWTKEINTNCSVPGEKPVEEAGLLGEGRRRDQESCIL